MPRRPLPLLLLILVPLVLQAAPRQRAIRHLVPAWETPRCAEPNGLLSMKFATDATPRPAGHIESLDIQRTRSVLAIAASPAPNVLHAFFEGALYESRNAGCTWSLRVTVPQLDTGLVEIIATHPSRIYIHSAEHLARLSGNLLDTIAFPERILRLFADPRDALHLRAVTMRSGILESHDGGTTWAVLGQVTLYGVYAAAIDPSSFDHMLVATTEHGRVMQSRDGGRSWSRTTFPSANVWSLEFSPVDPRVIWAQGLELPGGDRIFRSTDGGETWTRFSSSGDHAVTFSRALLAPHPTRPDTIAVTAHQGVAIYANGTITVVGPNTSSRAIEWSPAGTLYFADPVLVNESN